MQKYPGADRDQHVNDVDHPVGDSERNGSQDVNPTQEAENVAKNSQPGAAGGQCGDSQPAHDAARQVRVIAVTVLAPAFMRISDAVTISAQRDLDIGIEEKRDGGDVRLWRWLMHRPTVPHNWGTRAAPSRCSSAPATGESV